MMPLTKKFDYVDIVGRVYNDPSIPRPDAVQQTAYAESEGKYRLKIGFIPKEKGTFLISLCEGLSNGLAGGKNCHKATFRITLTDTDQHFYLRDEWMPDNPIDRSSYGAKRVYYFKVI